ncbi:MAG: hypothetical protein H6908_03200 [Hyphomicrobiales bacterium]|nr:hypothetical protein [Rickettsiales bacterium]MCP5361635.1 hypothetical protein [Hyphomicrobiales bacterium]
MRYITIFILLAVVLLSVTFAQAEQTTRYTCPMHPQIISDEPGTCPICGMDLVPLESGDHSHQHAMTEQKPIISIAPGTIQTIGIRTTPVIAEDGILIVPNAAVLRSSMGNHVIVALGNGRFHGQDVTIGNVSGGNTQVLSGLKEGQHVVTRAQFMIDAESNLREALDKLEGGSHAGH